MAEYRPTSPLSRYARHCQRSQDGHQSPTGSRNTTSCVYLDLTLSLSKSVSIFYSSRGENARLAREDAADGSPLAETS